MMRSKRTCSAVLQMCSILCLVAYLPTAGSAAPFYEGKKIRLVVAFSPGGTADADGRMIARHLRKHIPGNPKILVQSMPGAGGVVAVNLAYERAKPDGLSIFQLASAHYLQQLGGSDVIKFDVSRMPLLGAWTRTMYALTIRTDSPYTSIEDIRKAKEPPLIATHGTGTGVHVYNLAWQKALGINLKLIPGYSSSEQNAAVERGEVHGRTNSVGGILRRSPHWIKKKFALPVVQAGPERDPRIPDVPTVYDLNPNPGPFYETVNEGLSVARPYVLPPGTPADRVATLRQAWQRMLKDTAFIAEAKRLKWQFVPTPHDKVERFYKKVVKETPPEVVKTLKELFP